MSNEARVKEANECIQRAEEQSVLYSYTLNKILV